jgi:hypothetical protein
MNYFKTTYNYLILGLRTTFFLFFILLLIALICLAPELLESEDYSFKTWSGLSCGIFLLNLLTFRFGKLLKTQRNNLIIKDKKIIIQDTIFKTEKVYELNEIKGFSLSKYPTKIWNFKEIIIYVKNGDKIEFPQFLYLNFKDFKTSFENYGLAFLGFEEYSWKFLDKRNYKYE